MSACLAFTKQGGLKMSVLERLRMSILDKDQRARAELAKEEAEWHDLSKALEEDAEAEREQMDWDAEWSALHNEMTEAAEHQRQMKKKLVALAGHEHGREEWVRIMGHNVGSKAPAQRSLSSGRKYLRQLDRGKALAGELAGFAKIKPATSWQLRPMSGLSLDHKKVVWRLAVDIAGGQQPTRDQVAYASWHVRLHGLGEPKPSRLANIRRRLLGR
jgi:hypothetical protein